VSRTDPPLIGSRPTPILRQVSKIYADITMSLDGFITEPNMNAGNPLGDDPGRLHDWMFDRRTEADAEVRDELYARSGAVVIGRRMFDVGFERARAAARGKDVGIWGGGRTISEALKAGVLDEIQIHLVPLLLGDGRRLFVDVDDRGIELERTRTIETANATHLTFRVTSRAAA
jgi:dihydrofolate reductase